MNSDRDSFTPCAECHMLCSVGEYHPYAACVLYRQLGQADKVKSCLDSMIEYATRTPAATPERINEAEYQAALIRRDGFMCEQHPGLEFEHDPDCAGPGMPWVVEGREAITALLAPATPDSALHGTPRDQAVRIVRVWRGTDQHDQLLIHYIRQAIEDNRWDALTTERNRIRVGVERLREYADSDEKLGYNRALDDVLAIIDGGGGK